MASVRDLRVARGITRVQLAELCNTSVTTVRYWDIKQSTPTPLFQKKLFEIFGEFPDNCKNPRAPRLSPTCLRSLRVKHGFSQKKLSQKLGIAASAVALWELHKTRPAASSTQKLVDFFGMLPDECKPPEVPAIRISSTSIRALRESLGISQEELGELCGRKAITVKRWEQGAYVPSSLSVQKKLREIFGVTPDECIKHTTKIISSTSLKALREARGLSQRELSKAMGIQQTAIARWETRRAIPNRNSRLKLQKFFGVMPVECVVLPMQARGVSPTSLKSLRESRGMIQKELAALCGVYPVNIIDWEYARHKPSPAQREKLIEIFGVVPDECAEPKTFGINIDWRIGDFFTFKPKQIQNQKSYKRKPMTLKLKARTENFLIFTDCGGCTQTFTSHQLRDFTSITCATKQEIKNFQIGFDIFVDL